MRVLGREIGRRARRRRVVDVIVLVAIHDATVPRVLRVRGPYMVVGVCLALLAVAAACATAIGVARACGCTARTHLNRAARRHGSVAAIVIVAALARSGTRRVNAGTYVSLIGSAVRNGTGRRGTVRRRCLASKSIRAGGPRATVARTLRIGRRTTRRAASQSVQSIQAALTFDVPTFTVLEKGIIRGLHVARRGGRTLQHRQQLPHGRS